MFARHVVLLSGSILGDSLKSTALPVACSFSARFLVASLRQTRGGQILNIDQANLDCFKSFSCSNVLPR
jgi:hypothetical protein